MRAAPGWLIRVAADYPVHCVCALRRTVGSRRRMAQHSAHVRTDSVHPPFVELLSVWALSGRIILRYQVPDTLQGRHSSRKG